MAPAPSPARESVDRISVRDRAAHIRYRRALMLMTMTLVVPGSAQLAAGNREVGRIALRIWLALVTIAVLSVPLGLMWHEYVFWLASDTALLNLLRYLL